MNSIHRLRILGAILLIAPASASALAAEAPPRSLALGLDDIPARVRAHNPSLAAARYRIAEARGRLTGSGRLSNPELETEYRGNTDTSENAFEISLSQSFPLTDRLRLEKEVSRAEVTVAENEVRDAERLLIARARRDAVRYLASDQAITLSERQGKVADELATFIESLVERGEGSALDAGGARLESTQADLKVRQLAAAAATLLSELKPLLGLAPGDTLALKGGLPPPALPGAPAAAIDPAARPDYRALLGAIDAAQNDLALERANRFEDVKVGIVGEFAREEDAPVGLEDESIIGFRLSIPLPFWNRNEGAIEEKTAARKRSEGEAAALANDIQNEAAAALGRMRSHLELLREIDTKLLPLAGKQLELADTAYRNALTDIQTVLRARDQMIQFENARMDALRDFHLARIDFETAQGPQELAP